MAYYWYGRLQIIADARENEKRVDNKEWWPERRHPCRQGCRRSQYPGVEAEELFGMFYGELCKTLADSHRVERFAYDWRQPLDVLGERLGEFLDQLMKQTQQPIRLLAHSMGGLVVRACIHKRRPVMDALMARDGARLVMLGTPHQGAHSMVENLLGKGDTLRMLVRWT